MDKNDNFSFVQNDELNMKLNAYDIQVKAVKKGKINLSDLDSQ